MVWDTYRTHKCYVSIRQNSAVRVLAVCLCPSSVRVVATFPGTVFSRWSWSLHLFLGRPMFLLPFGLYCSACFGSVFVSILCTCCSYFSWYCFISFTMFCAPLFCLIHRLFSLSSFVIPSKCLKNFMCAASKLCSSLFFSTQASLPNFNAAFAVMLAYSSFGWKKTWWWPMIAETFSFYIFLIRVN